jgi:hypothetical protein
MWHQTAFARRLPDLGFYMGRILAPPVDED